MEKEKQIEEMAKDLCRNSLTEYCASGRCQNPNCLVNAKALETLYNAGYRKASDVAEEIFAEIEEGIKSAVSALQFETNPIHRKVKHETYSSLMRFVKTIEKKYTEEI
jgi:hypothetical protein